MAARPSLLAHGDEPVHRAGYGPPPEQQISLGVHLDHAQAELRETARTHVAGHPLPLDDAGRVRARRDRARLAVPRVAMGLGAAAEVMTVDHTLEAATLRDAGDLHQVPQLEDRDRDRLPRSEEHTSELQSPCNLVCRLLLEKKKIDASIDTHYIFSNFSLIY